LATERSEDGGLRARRSRVGGTLGNVADAVGALAVLLGTTFVVAARALTRGTARPAESHRLLVLDAAYSLSAIRHRNLEPSVTSRDLDGYFEHVWSVHPLVGADPDEPRGRSVGRPREERLAPRHTFIEGAVALSERGREWPLVNFALAQAALFLHVDKVVARSRVDVVRVGDPYYLGLLGLALKVLHGVVLTIRVNGNYDAIYESVGRLAYPRLFRKRSIEKRVERFVFPRADLVAGANQNNLDYAIANGARRDRVAVFRYGNLIHPVHFTPPEERRVNSDVVPLNNHPLLICVSRLEPVKHPEDAISVLTDVTEKYPEAALVLVGEGSMRDELLALAEELDVADHVFLVGNRTQDWIASALVRATVVLSPMTGRALVEAALSATPIVAYDIEWHGELLKNKVTGILVPYRDHGEMARRVIELVDDPESANSIGRAGRTFALEMMDPQRLIERERAAYEAALARSVERRVST